MAQENRCLKCGAQMPRDAPEGLCPKCLMKGVMSKEDADVTLESPRIEGPGTTIGRYKLLELIGEGGMGLVYLAEQQEPIHRRAALKIVKLGMDTKQVIARFEAEKQMLALLDHPNIARVYDAGTTETGRPYFVMEYVKGQSITEYCDQNKTGIEDRLKLFRQVCDAVQYAHQKGIIHRDIKPSNILISMQGDKAVPKIIDFGIAKAVTQTLTERTLFTQQGQLLGTPEYMSPEQTDLATQDIDTRSDIYSLGVVLYQLLAGVLPFGRESFEKGGFAEIQRIIQEVDPPLPSTALTKLGEEAKKIAERRKTQVVPLARRLHRELEWIPLKAMRKERVRRYRSASELADDIQNYLNGNPLLAGPESVLYRLRKVFWKHRLAVLTTTIVVATLLVGFAVSTYLYLCVRQAQHKVSTLEESEADHRLSTAQRLQAEGRYREALNEVEAYLKGRSAVPKAHLLHANLLYTLDRFPEAVAELDKLTEGPPEIAGPAHCLLATIYLGLDPVKAEKHRHVGESLLPETAEAYSLRGMTSHDSESTVVWLSRALDLDPGHYPSRKARALASYAVEDYVTMARDAEAMIVARPKDSLGYGLRAIAKRQTGSFDEAIADHSRAIALCDVKVELAELHNQRRKTFTCMGDHKAALQDARRCLELSPDDLYYKFNVFTALFLSDEFEAAGLQYGIITRDDPRLVKQFKSWASRFVFETLAAGMAFELPEAIAGKPPFNIIEEAAEQYHACETRATLLVPRAFAQAGWSPDGKQLAYGRTDWYAWPDETQPVGTPTVYGASGIEILNLETGAIRQLAMTGKDPAWSPDGRYIVFNHVSNRSSDYCWQAGLWITSTKGGPLKQLTEGGWPIWGREPGCLYFHDRGALNRMHIDDPAGTRRRVVGSPPFFALSPDEQYVAYAEWSVVKIVQVSTGDVVATWKAPPPEGYQQIYLRWSPDGKEILLAGSHTSDLGLWSYDVEHGEAWQIFPSPAVLATISSDKTKLAVALREHIGGIWLAKLDPNLLIRESMTPALTQQDYLRQSCPRFTKAIKRGTFRPDAYAYLSSFMTKMSELGKAYYQTGRYQDALETLNSLADLQQALGAQVDVSDIAFTVMSLCRLGRADQAIAAMDELRCLCDDDRQPSRQKLLYEAELVLAETDGNFASFWQCMRDGMLDEAYHRLEDIVPLPDGQHTGPSSQATRLRKILSDAFYEHGKRRKYTGGDYGDAIADYNMAAQLDQSNTNVLCDLAWLQAARPQVGLRDYKTAGENVVKACELTEWKDHRYVAVLAAVCAQADDFASAVEWQNKAVGLLTAQGRAQWGGDYESRLKLYRSNKQYDKGNLWSFCSGKMVGWWKFDEVSGQTVGDSSGNQCTGTLVGNPKWEQSGGKIGGALAFDGDWVRIGSEELFDITDAITVTAWVKVQKFDKWWQALVTKGDSSWRLYREGDSNNLGFHCDGVRSAQEPWATSLGRTVVNDGKWHHVAGVYDGLRMALYVDGQLDASCEASGRIQTNNYPVVIGDNAQTPGRQWSGLIDDVRIYSYALSEAEIKGLYVGEEPSPTKDLK